MPRMDARIAALLTVTFLLPAAAAALSGAYSAAIVMEERSGEILFAENEHARLAPASMVKMMTELVVLEHAARGELSLDDIVTVSARASRIGGSQVYLKEGETFTVRDLLMALAIHSGNDAGVALAEHVAGTDDAFVVLMNARARELGMRDTVFHSVHGLPPARGQWRPLLGPRHGPARARDLPPPGVAGLGRDGPGPLPRRPVPAAQPQPPGRQAARPGGHQDRLHRRGGLLPHRGRHPEGRAPDLGGHGRQDQRRPRQRDHHLLARGFTEYSPVKLVPAAGDSCPRQIPVKGGKLKTAGLVFTQPLEVGVRKARAGDVTLRYELPDRIEAPATAGTVVGKAVGNWTASPWARCRSPCPPLWSRGASRDRVFKR